MTRIGFTSNSVAFGFKLPKVKGELPPRTKIELPKLKPGQRLTDRDVLNAAALQESNARK